MTKVCSDCKNDDDLKFTVKVFEDGHKEKYICKNCLLKRLIEPDERYKKF